MGYGMKKLFNVTYGFLKPRNRGHVETSDDRHERIEVSNVEALSGSFYPVLNDPDALLLFGVLQ